MVEALVSLSKIKYWDKPENDTNKSFVNCHTSYS